MDMHHRPLIKNCGSTSAKNFLFFGWLSFGLLGIGLSHPFHPPLRARRLVTVRNGELVWSVSAFAETEVVVGVCGVTYFFYRGGLRED